MDSPNYPSPGKTAQQQGAVNQGTAITQQLLNFVNQRTPYGSLDYKPTGTYSYTDPTTGKTVNLPSFTATSTLTPAQRHLNNQSQRFDRITNRIGIAQAGRIQGLLSKPLNLNNNAVEARLMELGRKRLDPIWNDKQAQLTQQMQNRGIAAGSQAYDAAQHNFDYGRNDAYNNLLLTGRGQAVNEALTQRNQPINETTALMSGGQVQQPNFVNTPNVGVQGVDLAGMKNAQYQGQNANYQAMLGGLSGLGAAGVGGWAMSERKTKENVEKVGKLNNGLDLYKFKYKPEYGGGLMQLGVMAGEVEKKIPSAVTEIAPGIRAVNYSHIAEALGS
jgi:hypothetical protein